MGRRIGAIVLLVALASAGCGGDAPKPAATRPAVQRPSLPTSSRPGSVARFPCPARPKTTIALQSCAARHTLRLNAAVNTQVSAIWSLDDTAGRRHVAAAERSWQAYVAAECTSRSGAWIEGTSHTYAGGTLAPVAYAQCQETLTAAHLDELQETVSDRCAGRIKTGACRSIRPRAHSYILRAGDTVAVPAIHQVCAASGEGGAPDLFCARPRDARHQVVIFDDEILVWKIGNPDAPAWSGKP